MLIIKSVWGAWGRKFESCHPDLLKALNFLRSSVLFSYFRPRCLCFSHTDRFFNAKKRNALHRGRQSIAYADTMLCMGQRKALHKNSHKDELPLYLSSTQVLSRFPPNVRVSATQIGKAMKDLGYNQVRANNVRFWALSERTGFDITHTLPDNQE